MRPWGLVLLLGLSLAVPGCFGLGSDDPDGPEATNGCSLDFLPATLVHDAGPQAIGGEPAIAFAPDGTMFIVAAMIPLENLPTYLAGTGASVANEFADVVPEPGGQNFAWRSADGVTWTALHDQFGRLSEEGHQGNEDADVAISTAGTVHVPLFGASGIEILSSQDQGDSWVASGLVSNKGVDRQWILTGDAGQVWVTYRFQGTTELAMSRNDGATWETTTLTDEGSLSGPLAFDAQGRLVQVVGVDDGVVAAFVSADEGANWDPLAGELDTWGRRAFVVPFVDAAGVSSLVWTHLEPGESTGIRWVQGDDTAWGSVGNITPPELSAVFPWPVLRPDGSLVVFYYGSTSAGDATAGERTWDLRYSLLCANASEWTHGVVREGVHQGAMCLDGSNCALVRPRDQDDRSVGEVFEAGVSPEGRVWVTWTGTQGEPIRSTQIWIAGEAV